jgi:hypothetical protein
VALVAAFLAKVDYLENSVHLVRWTQASSNKLYSDIFLNNLAHNIIWIEIMVIPFQFKSAAFPLPLLLDTPYIY